MFLINDNSVTTSNVIKINYTILADILWNF